MIPYRFDHSTFAEEVSKLGAELGPGDESGTTVSVAGRVMLMRPHGKLAFAEMRDSTGAVQLFALDGETSEYDAFIRLNLGDWVGAVGEIVKTKRGEVSVKIAEWHLLAEARRPFGDKWRGISDVEIRYRQREVDLWANEGTRTTLLLRSEVIRRLRERLWEQGFVEVETPMLHALAGGAHAKPFITHYNSLDTDFRLRIAPELFLKRLVVGGFERVFEIGRVFRNEGLSPRHMPEFTGMELYQAYADHKDLMVLVEELVAGLAQDTLGTTTLEYQGRSLDLTPPWERATMAELVSGAIGTEVDVHTDREVLRRAARDHAIPIEETWGPGKLLLELYEKTVEADLWGPIFVCEHPAEVSPLARRHRDDDLLVERFEPVVAGRELGNAFTELIDPDEQRARFEDQLASDEEAMPLDEDYLRALEHGLPPTAGLGIGIDRLVMLFADAANIRDVIAFPTLRPAPGQPEMATTGAAEAGAEP